MINGGVSEPYVPFDQKGAVDYETLKAAINWLQDKGVRGFMVNGIGAEALVLGLQERKKVLESVLDVAKTGSEISVLITSYSPDAINELARHAKDAGASSLVITQHPVYPMKKPVDYFKSIASKSPLPLILYNEKQLGNLLSAAQVVSILKIDGFVGYKDSTKDVGHLQEVVDEFPKKSVLLSGSDSLIYTTYTLGGKGIVSLIINVFPQLVFDLVKSMESRDFKKGLELQAKVNRVRGILKSYGFSAGYRAAAKLAGNYVGHPFTKDEELSEQEVKDLEQKLKNEKLI
ncbi:MAG: dihydrodipicolinate synthase family protein [Nitrososphaerota archaeon]|jgi:dihydrodipicolinate synthase/N-acetylneuraminate lyase|nr:dihydrodipicolinate synthase family protein [Nitrososphaerota archaeon]MDG6928199.1 dihydrodipicolinate synthase family protein [Nitrososphaerota archaeon]MDG6930972.1 dihydrodipicolinate synthase family protein [Nitrososphaerota archaeon]MDG6932017.1 dihydrodipicolinate synthase family protein [Nitrososphaerota archaeon]MDG6935641.1 dihydrodipicolinate synthase family protein [Nitrososphaerota archaeon]